MGKEAASLLALLVAILACCEAASTDADVTTEGSGYTVYTSNPEVVNGKCEKTVTVVGPEIISDEFKVDCGVPTDIITTDKICIVGDIIYSDTPNVLVEIKNGRCTLKTYHENADPTSKAMTGAQCSQVKKKIRDTKSRGWWKWWDTYGPGQWSDWGKEVQGDWEQLTKGSFPWDQHGQGSLWD